VPDLDLAGVGLLSDRDGEGEHTDVVVGGDVVALQALPQEQLAGEVTMGPLRHLDLIALGLDPGSRRSHGEDTLLDRHLDEPGIHTGQVEMNLQLVATTVGVDRDRARSAF
jgi:hypothetical protein